MKIYLDLLPQERKQQLKRKKNFRMILRQQALFLLPLVVFIVILINVQYLLGVQLQSVITNHSNEQSQEKYKQLSQYEEKFASLNSSSSALLKIQKNHLHWISVLSLLDGAVPERVYLSNMATKNYQVMITGKAKNREDLLAFKDHLEKIDCFQIVNVPLSNLVVKEDIAFQLDFQVKQECLMKTN